MGNESISLIGLLIKDFEKRPEVLRCYDILAINPETSQTIEISDNDRLYFEDEGGRFKVYGLTSNQFVNGLVVGLYGIAESDRFNVKEFCYPQISLMKPFHSDLPSFSICFISNLCIDRPDFNNQKLISFLDQHNFVICLGNNFQEPKPNEEAFLSTYSHVDNLPLFSVQLLSDFLKQINSQTCSIEMYVLR
jgi:hypothetical protein